MNERPGRGPASHVDAQRAAPPLPHHPLSAVGTDASTPSQPPTGTVSELIQSRGVVLAILFLVTGALGIPLLWMNRKFSNSQRIALAIIVTIYTLILLGITCAILIWSYRQIFG